MADDAVMTMLNDIRRSRPPVYLADEWANYLHSIAQCILALPSATQQWSASVLVAGDVMQAAPGISMLMAYAAVQEAVHKASAVQS